MEGARGLDPNPYIIHKLLRDGQYKLSRDGFPIDIIYNQEDLRTPDEVAVNVRPSVKSSKVKKPASNLKSGEKKVQDVPRGRARKNATATERSTELDHIKSSFSKSSEGAVLEEQNRAEGDQLVHQNPLKEAEIWDFGTVLSMFRLGERPLGEGKTRVRWRCGCGRNMYDDFTELRSGAAAELEKWLNESMRNHALSGSSKTPQNASLRSAASPNASTSGHQQTAESDISLQSLASTANTLPGSYGTAAIALDIHLQKCWLLVCGKLQRGPDSLLTQLDLSSTPSDKKLFSDLRKSYSRRKSTWNVRPFLRDVKTIRFVQVFLSYETNSLKPSLLKM